MAYQSDLKWSFYNRWWCYYRCRWPLLLFTLSTIEHLFSWRSRRSCLRWFCELIGVTSKEPWVLLLVLPQSGLLSCWLSPAIPSELWLYPWIHTSCLWMPSQCPHKNCFISCTLCLYEPMLCLCVSSCMISDNTTLLSFWVIFGNLPVSCRNPHHYGSLLRGPDDFAPWRISFKSRETPIPSITILVISCSWHHLQIRICNFHRFSNLRWRLVAVC